MGVDSVRVFPETGFASVVFFSYDSAKRAVAALHGHVLSDHGDGGGGALEVELSMQPAPHQESSITAELPSAASSRPGCAGSRSPKHGKEEDPEQKKGRREKVDAEKKGDSKKQE